MALQHKYNWFKSTEIYAKNKLAIMVYKGNPKGVVNFDSLTNPKLRLCMPNPEWEGIAKHAIIPALKKTGGENLVKKIYTEKVKNGSTFLTHIHHRQTPVNIMQRKCDAGVVWYTEAYFHDHIAHHPVSVVKISDKDNKIVGYTAALMKSAPHKAVAKDFMTFLMSKKGQKIYRHYGFMKP